MLHEYTIDEKTLLLRSLTAEDVEMLRCWRNQEDIRKWFLRSDIISQEAQAQWFEAYQKSSDDLMFVIVSKAHMNKPVGTIALYHIHPQGQEAELGRLMLGDRRARQQGIAVNAVRALCCFARETLGIKALYLEVFKNNLPAIRLYEKIGFKIQSERQERDLTLLRMYMDKDRFNP